MELKELHPIGVLALRNAIIQQAANDYVKYYNPNKTEQSSYIDTLERWFKSHKFDDLCTGYSGQWFIDKLRELAVEGKKPGEKVRLEKDREKRMEVIKEIMNRQSEERKRKRNQWK